MLRLIIFLVFNMCMFFGCAPEPDFRSNIEVHSTARDVDNMRAAVAFWESVADCDLWASVEYVPDVPLDVGLDDFRINHFWRADQSLLPDLYGHATENTLGFALSNGNIVIANEVKDDERLVRFMLHELGHTLGLPHDEADSETIMNPTPKSAWNLSEKSLGRLAQTCEFRTTGYWSGTWVDEQKKRLSTECSHSE